MTTHAIWIALPFQVVLFAFLIGAVSGLRAFTAPTVVAWAAHANWLQLRGTPLSFMGSGVAVVIFTLLAVVEIVMDKLPSTPSRLKPAGMIPRIVLGGLSGAAIAASAGQSPALGAVFGVAGGVAGAFVGHALRVRLVKALKVPDFAIALLGDVVAIGGGLLIVSRF
ncbi:MAG: DUF4126 family protein [Candidatus Acidiferrales bacterium]|jgi:uncharacterized membrane protein